MVSVTNTSQSLHVAAAASVVVFIFLSFLINCGRKHTISSSLIRKNAIRVAAIALISLAYIGEAIVIARHSDENSTSVLDFIIANAFLGLAWCFTLLRGNFLVTELFGLSLISLAFGIPLFILDIADLGSRTYISPLLGVQAVRFLVALGFFVECCVRLILRSREAKKHGDAEGEEEASLVANDSNGHASPNGGTSYGTTPATFREMDDDSDDSDVDSDDEDYQGPKDSQAGQIRRSGSWMVYLQNFGVFVPYLIPRKDFKVQACFGLCIAAIIGNRAMNIFMPAQLGIITDMLIRGQLPFRELAIYYAMYMFSEALELMEALAKIPIEQFSYRQLTNAAFNHVMNLSMEFHSDRDSAEVMKAVEQGSALTRLLDTAVLEMSPTILDMGVAFTWLYIKFNSSVALCMVAAAFAFISSEVVSSTLNIDQRRTLTKAQRAESRSMHQAVQGWLTVSAFNMFRHEKFKFGSAVNAHLTAKVRWQTRDALTMGMCHVLIPTAFALIAGLVIHDVYVGRSSPGDFVFLIQYWELLAWPIRFLTREYRYIMKDLIDAERLLDLLTTEPTVKDKEGALEVDSIHGQVDFDSVGFTYDSKRTAIRDVTFSAAPGQTVALIGTTGAGKSSLMKLLMRYYDVTSGSIRLDGHDIRDMTQSSVREAIGVVPQDPLLFNATIMENLRYARLSATDAEIHDACRSAAIHDKIITFPDGYATKVGEQGVKLSGGEVQRLAIARVFLKDPAVLILDEATSAVDTETEAAIQGALRMVSRKRTTFVIAHRLSTAVGADKILVVEEGEIIERGRHEELVARGGKYASLWAKQLGKGSDEEEQKLVDV